MLGTGPPLVLLHGLTGSNRYWGAEYDRLAESRTVVIPDLRGFGRSAKPETGYRLDDHVDAVAALLAELDIDGPPAFGAHSIGCVIALRYACRHPEVTSVVGFGPPLFPSSAAARDHLRAMGPMERLFVLPGPVARRACAWVCDHRALSARLATWTHPSLPRPVAEDSVQHTWSSYSETLSDVLLTDHGAWLGELTCAAHFVVGDRDRVVDVEHLRVVTSSRMSLDVWPGGHHLPLRDARRCAAYIHERSAGDADA